MNLSLASLSTQPNLSAFVIEDLNLSNNHLDLVDDRLFPRGLKRLDLSKNGLSSGDLPEALPPTLEVLNLSNNRFTTMKQIQEFPPNLKVLDVQSTSLQSLEGFQCDSLEELHLSNTPMKIAQNLPRSLKHLKADYSGIRMLPNRLPPHLETLQINSSFLHNAGLPIYWGTALHTLSLRDNQIKKFPKYLPDTLRVLNLIENQLEEVPAQLPAHLQVLLLKRNNIRKITLSNRQFPIRIVVLSDNQLTLQVNNPRWAVHVEQDKNWNLPLHEAKANQIQKVWRRYRMRNRLRTWYRKSKIQEELYIVSMMPDRIWQVDTLSPEWKRPN